MCRNSPGGSAPSEPMRSPATISWTWRRPPTFVSVLTSRLTPIWRSACLTASRPRCQSRERRSQRRSGRHRRPPGLRRLQCRSPVLVPSMARLISRLDTAILGPRVAAGDPALDDLAGESAGLPLQNPDTAALARPLCGHRGPRRCSALPYEHRDDLVRAPPRPSTGCARCSPSSSPAGLSRGLTADAAAAALRSIRPRAALARTGAIRRFRSKGVPLQRECRLHYGCVGVGRCTVRSTSACPQRRTRQPASTIGGRGGRPVRRCDGCASAC